MLMKLIGRFYLLAVSLGMILTACSDDVNHRGKTPLVEAGGQFLYQEDLRSALPVLVGRKDSAEFVEKFMQNWIEDALLYKKAEGNIPDNAKIEELVSSYRKALIMHTYQEELVNQEVGQDISDEEIEKYYNEHAAMFRAVQPYIKGLFIKVPITAPHLNNVRVWYQSNSQVSIDHLEKYTISNAVSYDYFYDDWKPLADFSSKIPLKELVSDYKYLEKKRNVEVSDTSFYYFLHVENFLPEGDILPLEYAKGEIKDILVNLKRVEYINKMKHDLYDDASENKEIKYY